MSKRHREAGRRKKEKKTILADELRCIFWFFFLEEEEVREEDQAGTLWEIVGVYVHGAICVPVCCSWLCAENV